MNKKYFYKYAISKQQQIQKESNHFISSSTFIFSSSKNLIFKISSKFKKNLTILFQVALLFFLPQKILSSKLQLH